MTIDFEEFAALDAAGALTLDEQQAFEQALAVASAEVRARVAEIRDVMPALAELAGAAAPRPQVKADLMAKLGTPVSPPEGFSFRLADEPDWIPHVVPGIRMKLLSMNRQRGYATLLLDVAPGARFPPHHHGGDEECYVISGTLYACGRKIGPGDFHHADAGSDHGELYTEEGCRVLLVVPPEDYLPA
jgi:anti-sigma factor ChrR (cupin superfamily)